MRPRSLPSARLRAYTRFALRHGVWLWFIATLLAVPAAFRAVGLYVHLKSDLEELLPRNAPSVVALDELRSRMQGLRYLGVLVDAQTKENLPAAERFLDDLAARVRAYPGGMVTSVKTGVGEERRYLEGHALLYVDTGDLETVRDRVEASRDAAVMRGLGDDFLDDDTKPEAVPDFHELEAKYRGRTGERAKLTHDRFSSADKHLSLLLIEAAKFSTGKDQSGALFEKVESDIRALGGVTHYAPGMRLGYTGDIAINVEELSALVKDLTTSSLVVVALVLLAVLLYYRWYKSVPALLLPLSLAVVYAFAGATLPPFRIANLNANTAFLASVIVGNGVNFGIILLARYVEERRAGRDIEDALAIALSGTRVGTLVAALAAAASYGSLMLTGFRGFAQFGAIGGLGMLACWAMTFLLAPSLIAWLDRDDSSRRPVARGAGRGPMHHLAGLVTRHPVLLVAGATALTALAALEIKGFDRTFIEYDFSKLRRADSRVSGSAYWGAKMDDLLGRYLTPIVMLSDGPEQAARLSRAMKQAVKDEPLRGIIDSVSDIHDVVPTEQPEKIAIIKQLERDLTPRVRATLSDEQKTFLDRYLKDGAPSPVGSADVPLSILRGFAEKDGTVGKTVLVYPRPSQATWQGPVIEDVTAALRTVASEAAEPGERPARVAGSIPLSADIIASVEKDAPRATAIALFAVTVLVVLIFRFTVATPLVVGSLVLGVAWLFAALMAFGLKINFCNFIAFPITFGIGVDYAVNVMARWREGNAHDVAAAVRQTGGAVTLCSATTIIGYGSLLFAQNQALFLFGVVAVLGELACLLTAIVVLPAVLTLLTRRPAPALDAGSPMRS